MPDADRPPLGSQHQRIGWNTPEGLDEAMIRAVVAEFYARARQDDVIGPVFNRVILGPEWPRHLETIADFWSSMLLGSGRYGGRPMPRHMAIPELSDVHFMRWLRLFRETVTELCPPEIASIFIERSERVGNSFRMNIAMRRGDDIMTMGQLKREPAPVWTPED
ncbi:group III truncated hemoglobin [Devosia aurantiaca]|uniref:Group III truncated hemoglobin n=1 Tax=Devosia aurantiaca TaxID=2714858 RepID=A0A6M1T1N7_9HYPH|nr:group III truncated hemoglobin [Devosia aurantiaca]NGP18761.1 group III truncated hemoglobin [Devosia aurantiaca]